MRNRKKVLKFISKQDKVLISIMRGSSGGGAGYEEYIKWVSNRRVV